MKKLKDRYYQQKREVNFESPEGRVKYWSCQRKQRFVSERIANQHTVDKPVPLRTYKCRECKGWHLTKTSRVGTAAFDVIEERVL